MCRGGGHGPGGRNVDSSKLIFKFSLKTKHNKAKQNKTKQNKMKQNKTKQNKTKLNKTEEN